MSAHNGVYLYCIADSCEEFSLGNVGIGTAAPTEKLEVVGTVKATAFEGDGSALTGIVAAPDNDWAIDGSNVYRNAGNVGIGTTTPTTKLEVVGDAKFSNVIDVTNLVRTGNVLVDCISIGGTHDECIEDDSGALDIRKDWGDDRP